MDEDRNVMSITASDSNRVFEELGEVGVSGRYEAQDAFSETLLNGMGGTTKRRGWAVVVTKLERCVSKWCTVYGGQATTRTLCASGAGTPRARISSLFEASAIMGLDKRHVFFSSILCESDGRNVLWATGGTYMLSRGVKLAGSGSRSPGLHFFAVHTGQ